jgi:hypothetical protein
MAARGLVVPDTGAHGVWPLVAAALPDMFETDQAAREIGKARSQGETRIRYIYGSPPVSSYKPGRAKLTGARYAVPVLLRSMDDLHRIDPGASFEPDRPSTATASKLHMGRADLAIGPEGEPVRELLTRVEPMPKPPSLCRYAMTKPKNGWRSLRLTAYRAAPRADRSPAQGCAGSVRSAAHDLR